MDLSTSKTDRRAHAVARLVRIGQRGEEYLFLRCEEQET